VLERLLAYRLTRLLQGSRLETGWPALWRVLHRPMPWQAASSSSAMTLQRHLHLAITHPVTLQLNLHGSPATSSATHNSRELHRRDGMLMKFTQRTERLTTQRQTLAERWSTQRHTLAERTSHADRWTIQQQLIAHHFGGPRPTPARGPSRRFQTPSMPGNSTGITSVFASPPRILGRPVSASVGSAPAPAPQVSTHMTPRYWDDQHASSVPPIAMLAPSVEHLTDQVLRTVDQRLVAARERLSKR
jgi:hypothetical protein